MPKPLTIDEPFPSTEGLSHDALSLRIISPAYASSVSELTAVLQYIYHSFFFAEKGHDDISETLVRIAIAEMFHLEHLGDTILALGANPLYAQFPQTGFNFYSAKYVSYGCNLKEMLENDIVGEKRAICGYEKMLKQLKNQQVKSLISRILKDEYLHLETLEKILSEFKC